MRELPARAAAVLLMTFACSPQADELGSIDALAASSTIWSIRDIPVCWENPEDGTEAAMNLVRTAVQESWQAHSAVAFTGWGKCTEEAPGIRIHIDDGPFAPRVLVFGSDLDGLPSGMSLNLSFDNVMHEHCGGEGRDACIYAITVHEFGHALGFAHESLRSDRPDSCEAVREQGGDQPIGPWDEHSVMNGRCNAIWVNAGRLSSIDVFAVQYLYGRPEVSPHYSLRNAASETCADIRYNLRYGTVIAWECHGMDNQLWALHQSGDAYQIQSAKGSCLSVAGEKLVAGQCDSDAAIWTLDPLEEVAGYQLAHGDRCVTLSRSLFAGGNALGLAPCAMTNEQTWQLVPEDLPY